MPLRESNGYAIIPFPSVLHDQIPIPLAVDKQGRRSAQIISERDNYCIDSTGAILYMFGATNLRIVLP